MLSHSRRQPALRMESLERRDLLTAAAELVSDFDFEGMNFWRSPISIVVAGDATYQIVRAWDPQDETRSYFTYVARVDGDLQDSVKFEGIMYASVVEDQLLLEAEDASLWKTDGTEEGTIRWFGQAPDEPRGIEFNDKLYFSVDDELWATDGTESGAQLVKETKHDVDPRFTWVNSGHTLLNGQLYFTVKRDNCNNPPYDVRAASCGETEVWKSDGSTDGTQLSITVPKNVNIVATIEGHVILAERDDHHIWVTDGTDHGTYQLVDGKNAHDISVVNDMLFYVTGRSQIWVSDGTNDGTHLVKEGRLDNSFNCGFSMFNTGEELYFSAIDQAGDRGLWKSDGTQAGTALVKEGRFAPMFADDGVVYLVGYEEATGRELWRTDGTPEGTVQFLDLNPGPESSLTRLSRVVVNNGMLYLTADDGIHGHNLWRVPLVTPPDVDRVMGDSNNDGIFDSSDLVKVFQAGKYEDQVHRSATFEEGDWNGDGIFDSSDLVAAFQAGTYSDADS